MLNEIAMSWASVAKKTRALSNALLDMGVAVQENVGIFSQNSIDWSIADIATLQLRAVTVPLMQQVVWNKPLISSTMRIFVFFCW